jgi:octaprenyl-diphosphate synthase
MLSAAVSLLIRKPSSFAEEVVRVPSAIEERLAGAAAPIREICGSAMPGGSHARAAFLLAAVADLGADPAIALPAAVAVELLHSASLIQDDIFDGATLRRGVPAAHVTYGTRLATLASDWLFMESYQTVAAADPRCVHLLICASQQLTQAEAIDIAPPAVSNFKQAWTQMLTITQGKTGALFATAVAMAALLAGCSATEQEQLSAAGLAMGTTFQFLDDTLDLFADSSLLGKDAGQDLAGGKITWPMLRALEMERICVERWDGAGCRALLAEKLRQPLAASILRERLHLELEDRWQEHCSQMRRHLGAGETLGVMRGLRERMARRLTCSLKFF